MSASLAHDYNASPRVLVIPGLHGSGDNHWHAHPFELPRAV